MDRRYEGSKFPADGSTAQTPHKQGIYRSREGRRASLPVSDEGLLSVLGPPITAKMAIPSHLVQGV
jgi:hypothetical protein